MSLIEYTAILLSTIFQSYVIFNIVSNLLSERKIYISIFFYAFVLFAKVILFYYNLIDLGLSIILLSLIFLAVIIISYKKPLTIKVLTYVIAYFILIIAEMITTILFLLINFEYKLDNQIQLSIISGMVTSMQLIIYIPLQDKFRKLLYKGKKLFNNLSNYYQIINISIVIGLLTIIYILIPFKPYNQLGSALEYIIIIIIAASLIAITYKKLYDNKRLIENITQLNKYNIAFEKILQNQRELTHEYKNELLLMRENLKNKQLNKTISLIDAVLKNIKENDFDQLSKAYNAINNNIVKQFLMYKIIELSNNNIEFVINVSGKTNINSFSSKAVNNYCRCIGIIFDNVKNAAKLSKKSVLIDVKQTNNLIEIEISNFSAPQKTKNIDFLIHGVGLNLLHKIIKRNKYLTYEIEKINDFYLQRLSVKSSKKNTSLK